MDHVRNIASWRLALVVLTLVGLGAAPARARTLYVANFGNDDSIPPCGSSKVLSCRSISKAIALADTGDHIMVGPGVYGDLNGSGIIGDSSGEEAAEVGSGCECMIKVNKLVYISSREGALRTVLDGRGLVQSVVQIQASSATLRGLTIRNGAANGVLTDAAVQKVRILGNIASGNPLGFNIVGSGLGSGAYAVRAQDNIAIDNTDGFSVSGNFNVLYANRAIRNSGNGFVIAGNSHSAKYNIGDQNNVGFRIKVEAGPTHPLYLFEKTAALANVTAGVLVDVAFAQGATLTLNQSNLYGNGAAANNCGLMVDNQDADTAHTLSVDATSNFWGATTGPGPEPADSAGGPCSMGPGSTNVSTSPAYPQEISISQHSFR